MAGGSAPSRAACGSSCAGSPGGSRPPLPWPRARAGAPRRPTWPARRPRSGRPGARRRRCRRAPAPRPGRRSWRRTPARRRASRRARCARRPGGWRAASFGSCAAGRAGCFAGCARAQAGGHRARELPRRQRRTVAQHVEAQALGAVQDALVDAARHPHAPADARRHDLGGASALTEQGPRALHLECEQAAEARGWARGSRCRVSRLRSARGPRPACRRGRAPSPRARHARSW